MANTTTLKARIINLLAANGPMTKREILTALGKVTTSYASYFAPRINVDGFYYTPKQLEDKRKASLVASGRIKAVGKNGRGEIYYAAV
jgi:hypothetical protein